MRLWAIRNIEAFAKALDRQGARLLMLGDFKIIVGISIILILTIIPARRGNREDTLASLYENHDLELS